MVSPTALVKSPLPSASIVTLSPTFWFLPQASMTKASLTDRQAMVLTPLARILSASWTKLGRCLSDQVGVNARGSANSTTFLPLNRSSVVIVCTPSALMVLSDAAGILAPALMVMSAPFGCQLSAVSYQRLVDG